MQDRIRVDEKVTVSSQPTEEELRELADRGYEAVMNLRTDGEEEQPLQPDEEGDLVEELGLEYRHFPVSPEGLEESLVDRFRHELEEIAKPVLVHCRRGKRSGAMVMMDRAVEKDMSGEETLEKAEEMGFECDVDELNRFVKNYVDENTDGAGGDGS